MVQKEGMDLVHNLLIQSLQVFEMSIDLFLFGGMLICIILNIPFGQILLIAILYIEQNLLLPYAVFIITHFTVYLGP